MKSSVSSSLQACLAGVGFTAPRPPMRLGFALSIIGFVMLAVVAQAPAAPLGDNKMEQTFPHAYAMRGCTQEDAPALEIYLTQTPFAGVGEASAPYIRVEISSLPSEAMEPASFNLIQMRRDPTRPGRIVRAALVESKHDPKWLSGTIALTEVTPGLRVSGHYDFTTPAGKRLDSSFTAEYSNRNAVCG